MSRVPPSDDNTTEEGGGDRYCGGTPGVSPDTLGHGGNPTTPVKIPPRLNLSFDTETPADQNQKQDDDFCKANLLKEGTRREGSIPEVSTVAEKRRRDRTLSEEEEEAAATPTKRHRVLMRNEQTEERRGLIQQQLSKVKRIEESIKMDMKRQDDVMKPGRGGRGSSVKKRKKKKEEEWNRIVASNHSIKTYLKPKIEVSDRGRGMDGHTDERSNAKRDTGKEERDGGVIERTADKLQVKLCGERARLKVSNIETRNNLCVDRVRDDVLCAEPGVTTRDTAVCGGVGDEEDQEVRQRCLESKDDISSCTHQRRIHCGGNIAVWKRTDTIDSDSECRADSMTEPDRKQIHR